MDMAGLGMLRDMDILFEVVMYQRNVVNQIGEPLDFDGLPADAVDFAGLDEEELAGIYQEIMMNAQQVMAGFSQQ